MNKTVRSKLSESRIAISSRVKSNVSQLQIYDISNNCLLLLLKDGMTKLDLHSQAFSNLFIPKKHKKIIIDFSHVADKEILLKSNYTDLIEHVTHLGLDVILCGLTEELTNKIDDKETNSNQITFKKNLKSALKETINIRTI